jgi:hypothetical protein
MREGGRAGLQTPGETPDVLRFLTVAVPFGALRTARVSKRSKSGVFS